MQPLEPVTGTLPSGTGTLGQAYRLDTYQLVTVPMAERGIFGPAASQSGLTYYTFLVQIESLDPTYSTHYNPLSFTMRDDQGFEYQATYADQARQPALHFGDLVKGEKIQGWLTMEGPVATTYVELAYRSNMGGEAIFRAALP